MRPLSHPRSFDDVMTIICKQEKLLHAQEQLLKAKDAAICSQNAQLVVQNLHLQKQNYALKGKEMKKEKKRTKLFPEGKGCVVTDDAFMALVEEAEARAKQAKAARDARTEMRTAAREAKADLEKA